MSTRLRPPPLRLTRPDRARAIVWVVVALSLLVLTQALALVHGIRHGGASPWDPTRTAVASAHGEGSNWGHEAGSADCQLLDQLSQAHSLPAVAPGIPGVPACPAWAPVRPSAAPARPSTHVHARGPPTS